jgi:hypothetical protein
MWQGLTYFKGTIPAFASTRLGNLWNISKGQEWQCTWSTVLTLQCDAWPYCPGSQNLHNNNFDITLNTSGKGDCNSEHSKASLMVSSKEHCRTEYICCYTVVIQPYNHITNTNQNNLFKEQQFASEIYVPTHPLMHKAQFQVPIMTAHALSECRLLCSHFLDSCKSLYSASDHGPSV